MDNILREREIAYKTLLSVYKDYSYSNLAMKKETRELTQSSGFIKRLVYGTLEESIYIDYFLDRLLKKGVRSMDIKALTILRMGAYQLEFMDSIPDYAAINGAVELGKKYAPGMAKLINGVLRSWQRGKSDIELPPECSEEWLSVTSSCRKEIVGLLVKEYGYKRAESLLRCRRGPGVPIRVNLSKTNKDVASEELKRDGYTVEESSLSPNTLIVSGGGMEITESEIYKRGEISIQSEGSSWIVNNLGVKPGYKVLDMCAAPGGKTLAMAEAMMNEGEIIACDLYEHRVNLIERNASRIGTSIVRTKVIDSTGTPPEEWKDRFDLVLIDAPCSGLGVMAKKPDIKLKAPGTSELVPIQKKLLENASSLVADGGKLAYSTCTITREENEDIISEFIKDSGYLLEYEGKLMPDENDRCDGFYLAVLRKKGEHPYGCGVQNR